MQTKTKKSDLYITKNIHGAWVINGGSIGLHQYYFYTKNQAIKLYLNECNK